MAVQMKIPGVTFSGDVSSFPVVRDDAILPTAGALVLVDPTQTVNPWAAGVPANGATVPNLAWKQAATALGTGTESTLAATIYNVGLTSTVGLVERTTKGGLHAIISPTTSYTDTAVGFNVAIPRAIYDYCRTNNTHSFYLSMWHRVTRAATDNGCRFSGMQADTTYLVSFGKADSVSQSVSASNTIDDTVGGNRFRNMAGTPGSTFGADTIIAVTGATNAPGGLSIFLVGNRHSVNGGSTRRGKGGSRILYRTYLEDLTVSGRSYATVSALDSALFTAACNTSGGRYYGDTFTDPATIA